MSMETEKAEEGPINIAKFRSNIEKLQDLKRNVILV
jgi:hypothetical protein